MDYLSSFDIVFISETKTPLTISLAGFTVYDAVSMENSQRGGIIALVKNYLVPQIVHVSLNKVHGIIWIELAQWTNYLFGGCYIPPSDSRYFDPSIFGELQGKILDMKQLDKEVFVIGDMNSRTGDTGKLRDTFKDYDVSYADRSDNKLNENGRKLLQLCCDTGCVVVNNLMYEGKTFGGGLTFHRKSIWISEIDIALSTCAALKSIKDFEVNQAVELPSDHAPLEMTLTQPTQQNCNILKRCEYLGKSSYENPSYMKDRKGISSKVVERTLFVERLSEMDVPVADRSIEDSLSWLFNTLESNAFLSRTKHQRNQHRPLENRWRTLIESEDQKTIWQAIAWNGELNETSSEVGPSDEDFKSYFEELLYANAQPELQETGSDSPYIPMLDDPITPIEVEDAIQRSKAKGYLGTCPALLKWIPAILIVYIANIFNIIFYVGSYPSHWCYSKLITIFKGGNKLLCGNYRGISIMDTFAKLYDSVLNARLENWLSIDKFQAGAQKGRGCIEQILSLRLLIDYCMYKKCKMYIMFIDFQKAYDKVPRYKVFDCLKQRGCGRIMLLALQAAYKCTQMLFHGVVISTSIGVRQGAPTSCLLFVLYIDNLLRMLKSSVENDGFLGSLHALLLMDDTVILATTREKCQEKFKVMLNFCDEYGMLLNKKKTKFMVINGDIEDHIPLQVEGIEVDYTEHYVYLGCHIKDDGKMSSVIREHAKSAEKHVNKFLIFLKKNTSMPYNLKRKVFDAALMTAILYGAETWLTDHLSKLEKHYNMAMKLLLGVRSCTPNILCNIEGGLPTISTYIFDRRRNFVKKFIANASGDEPLSLVLRLCQSENTPGIKLIQKALNYVGDPKVDCINTLKELCRSKAQNASRFETYLAMNPTLTTCVIYTQRLYVEDHYRLAFTRFRLSSHSLKVETGRWSRVPRVERVCNCNNVDIQDEDHVLFRCKRTEHIRNEFKNVFQSINGSMVAFMSCEEMPRPLIVYKTLCCY